MARTPTPPKKRPYRRAVKITPLTLTPEVTAIMQNLAQAASDAVGQRMSQSAVVRALVRWAGQQNEASLNDLLYPYFSQELAAGIRWGAVGKGGKHKTK